MKVFRLNGSGLIMSPFDSDKRYPREVAASADRLFFGAIGKTINVQVTPAGNPQRNVISWRWEVGPVSRLGQDQAGISAGVVAGSGFNATREIAL